MNLLINQADLTENTEASVQIEWRKLISSVRYAQQFRIKPLLGAALFDDITNAAPPDAAQQALIDALKPPLCWWALYEAVPMIHYSLRDKGVMKALDNTHEAANGSEVAFLRDHYKARAEAVQPDVIAFLRANKDDYPLWDDDPCSNPQGPSMAGRFATRPPRRTTSISDLANPKRRSQL
jgi:hypothetical protein